MSILIETCPKCGAELQNIVIATFPPIPQKKWSFAMGCSVEGAGPGLKPGDASGAAIDNDAIDDRQNRMPMGDFGDRYGHQVDIEGGEVGPLADLDGA